MVKPVACVIGWPVKHSRSPVIHRFWLNELGLDGDYVIQPVEPERVVAFFADFATSGFVGCNVTVPHKEAAFAAVAPTRGGGGSDRRGQHDLARRRQARRHQHRRLRLPRQSRSEAPGWDANAGPAVVLGAGGAARAIVWALVERGFAPVTWSTARANAPRRWPTVSGRRWRSPAGKRCRTPRQRARPGQHHHARHGRSAAARRRCLAAPR